jgi:hypothetical protein
LVNAAKEITTGNVEANLGGCLFKKRLPQPGGGKRGGYRVIVGYRRSHEARIIFLYAFAKGHKADISAREEAVLGLVAEAFIETTDQQIEELLAAGSIWEVQHHD